MIKVRAEMTIIIEVKTDKCGLLAIKRLLTWTPWLLVRLKKKRKTANYNVEKQNI